MRQPCPHFSQGAIIMWGCDYTSMSRGWEGVFPPWGFLSLLIWGVVILLIAYLFIRDFKNQEHSLQASARDRIDSLAILKARFASGEISEEQFVKMKKMLSGDESAP